MYIFNLRDLISKLNKRPIWLRYVTIKQIVRDKYKSLSTGTEKRLLDRLLDYTNTFIDYQFTDGTEYLIMENI